MSTSLLGVGLYTPREAQRLLNIPAGKITRWLRGHKANGKWYEPLWRPQVDLGDGSIYLGFRDLMELRTANEFMRIGISAHMIRKAIVEARKFVNDERPLSTIRFRTDGRAIFLEVAENNDDTRLLDLIRSQYVFSRVIEGSLKNVEFDGIAPSRWWVSSKRNGILVDPERLFGQPIEESTGIPTHVLAAATEAEGSTKAAAIAWCIDERSVRRAVKFETSLLQRAA